MFRAGDEGSIGRKRELHPELNAQELEQLKKQSMYIAVYLPAQILAIIFVMFMRKEGITCILALFRQDLLRKLNLMLH